MTLAALGALVPCDASTVSRIESGLLSPTERFAAACDQAFPQMGGWYTRFYNNSRKWNGPYPRWFADWVDAEGRATVLRGWEPLLVPGLLQTPNTHGRCSEHGRPPKMTTTLSSSSQPGSTVSGFSASLIRRRSGRW